MLAGMLPGLHEVRIPLAAGVTWLVAVWALWGRHLPAQDDATGFLRDAYGLAEYLGTVASLGVIAFVAYLGGSLWIMIRSILIDPWGLVRAIPAGRCRAIADLLSPWVLNNSPRKLMQSFMTTDGGVYGDVFRDLLPRLGVRRPGSDLLSNEDWDCLRDALFADLNRADVLMRDHEPDLLEEHARYYREFRFRANMAIPLAVCSSVLTSAATNSWLGLFAALLIGVTIWFAVGWSAADANLNAYMILLQAVYLERLPAPALTEAAGSKFGVIPSQERPFKEA